LRSSLYKIVFERTKAHTGGRDVSLANLPSKFKKNNTFIQIVDILRHSLGGGHLMDTFTQRSNQLSKSKMLKMLTGSKNEPNGPEEFYNLQLSILRMFESELKILNERIRSNQ